jgi:uncharacterized protein (DUF2147 family)
MLRFYRSALVVLVGVLIAASAPYAASDSPVGYWETIDDDGKTPTSIVQIFQEGDTLSGKILKIMKPGVDPKALCVACTGDLKDKPVVGLRFLWGVKKEGDDWEGGSILDPDTGKVYKCTLTLEGDKLQVRAFLGMSLFGRTQLWLRSQAP